jgi:general secretion pathway protein C
MAGPMRASAGLILLAAGGLGYGGWQLGQTLVVERAAAPAPVEITAELEQVARAAPPETPPDWPPIFDAYVPDPPQTQTPKRKPESYRLVGLVAGGPNSWAILASASGDRIVRVGDPLAPGETVLAIEEAGVRLSREGEDVLIGFDKTPQSLLEGVLSNDTSGPLEADLPISLLAGRDVRRVLGRAGSVRMVAPNGGQGLPVPEILWVREGHLYDLIGLRQGDKVLRVNGYEVLAPDMLSRAQEMLDTASQLAIEILRAGQRRTITVRITGRG